jgi:fatty acid desaturase
MFDATSSDEFNKTLQEIRSRLPYNARTMEKSNWYGLLICVRQAVVAVVVVVALQRINLAGSGRAVLSAFAFGVVAYRVQFILHDASHKTLFRSLTLNELVGWAFGMLIGVNFARYRYTHMWHHRLTGSVNDPQYRDYLHGTVSPIRYLTFLLGPLVGSRVIPYLGREFLTRNGDRKFDQHEPRVRISWYVCALVVVSIELLLLSNFGCRPFHCFLRDSAR